MSFRREQLPRGEIHYFDRQITSKLFPKERQPTVPRYVDSQSFAFTQREPLYTTSASACGIVALQGENNKWGLFHGSYNRRKEIEMLRERNELMTLEDYLAAWKLLQSKTAFAYLFSAGFVNHVREVRDYRDEIVNLVSNNIGLSDNQIIRRWNNFEEGETEVLIDPQTGILKVNLSY